MIDENFRQTTSDETTPVQAANKKTCIALMGEFSAGKTTLINFLLGADVLPTKVTATQVPPVWLSYGEDDEPFYVDSENRSYPVNLMDIQNLDVENVRYIKVFSDSAFLKGFDLIDTPGISDPNIPDFHRDTAIKNANAIIWCTHATQAWRESENSAWLTVPDMLRSKSLLVATRADKLDKRNRERVKKRLHREAGNLFDAILMFSATDALRAKSDDAPVELMEESGGAQLMKALWNIAGQDGALSSASLDESDAEVPATPRIQPVRVVNRQGRGRQRISADEARSVRNQLLSVKNAETLPMHETVSEPESLELSSADLTPPDDVEDERRLLLAPEDRLNLLKSTAREDEEEQISAPERADKVIQGSAIEDNCLTVEPEAVSTDVCGKSGDEHTLSALKEILHEEIESPEPDGEFSCLLNVVEARDQAITPLELWNQVQREYEVDTIDDVMGAVSILIEVMQEHRICFANCCGAEPSVPRQQEEYSLSLSG